MRHGRFHLGSIHPVIRIGSLVLDGTEWEVGQGDWQDAFVSIKKQCSHVYSLIYALKYNSGMQCYLVQSAHKSESSEPVRDL